MAFTEKDLDLVGDILPPTATYVDTMEAFHGWHRHDAEIEFEYFQNNLAQVYSHFGGSEAGTPLPPDEQEVEDYVHERSMHGSPYGWCAWEDEIVTLALKYLTGKGDDYASMHQLVRDSF